MNTYFARQPILDSDLRLYGYELLFRSDPDSNTSGSTILLDGDAATSSVLDAVNWGGIDKITAGTHAFVNFTERLLLDGVATLFDKDHLVVEVLESVEASHGVLEALQALREAGYSIALDDYVYRERDTPLLALSNIVKVEVDGTPKAYDNLYRVARNIDREKCVLLAEKVESRQVFDQARELGCRLFQGYFFARPKILHEKIVKPLRINQMRIMRVIADPNVEFETIANIIKNDVGLSYKTLRLVNSAYYGLYDEVRSINQAVVVLGRDELRKWLAFSALTTLSESKPSELVIMSMTRAFFCEKVAEETRQKKFAEAYFLAGLFSLLDTLTDTELEVCLGDMAVPSVTKNALLKTDNPGRDTLDLIIALENGSWKSINALSAKLGLKGPRVSELYLESIEWSQGFVGQGGPRRNITC